MRLMSQELPGRGGSDFKKRKLLLILLIIGLGIIVVSVLEFLYRIAKSSLGSGLAIVVVAGVTIGILFMVLVGIGMASVIELAICSRTLIFKSKPMPGSWLDLFLKLWGSSVEFPMPEPEPIPSDEMPPDITMNDVEELLLLIEQRKRGGKKSIHSDDVQFRTVRDWMILQSRGTSITLQQFLEERFGVAPHTGMPLVPNPTFYGWRRKFLSELEKYKKTQSGEK